MTRLDGDFHGCLHADDHSVGARQRELMRSLLSTEGISPQQVADAVLAGVEADDLWIHTHPDSSDAAIHQRYQALLNRSPTSLQQ